MEEDLDGLGVGGHDDELGDAAVERLGGCVCVLFFWFLRFLRERIVGDGVGRLSLSFSPRPARRPTDSPSLAPFLSCL